MSKQISDFQKESEISTNVTNLYKKVDLLSLAKSQECENVFKEYTKIAIDKYVFGAPTYILEDQIYWGQDRLEFIERQILKLNNSQ